MKQYKHFEIDEAAIIRDRTAIDPSLWRLLRRLCLPEKFNDPHGGIIKRAVVVDVETVPIRLMQTPTTYRANDAP